MVHCMIKKPIPRVFTLLLATSALISSPLKANSNGGLLDSLIDGVLKPEVYTGFMSKIQALRPTWFCDDNRYFWSLNWRGEVDNVDVHFDINNPDVTSVQITLKESSLHAQYYQRGGWTCSWDGASGRISVGRIDIGFNLYANGEDFPKMSVENLRLKGLAISDVEVMYASVFSTGFKNSSHGFAEWVENNLNSLIRRFMTTELKKRFDKALNEEIDRRLREREEQTDLIHP
jgi:hypothetical protein